MALITTRSTRMLAQATRHAVCGRRYEPLALGAIDRTGLWADTYRPSPPPGL